MKQIDTQELEKAFKEAQDLVDEVRRLDLMEGDARKNMEAATDEDITKESVQRKVADNRMQLDLVASRRKKITPPLSAVHRTLREQFKAKGTEWNHLVLGARQAKEDELVMTLLPFFLGDRKAAQRKVQEALLYSPVFAQYREAVFHFPYYPKPREQDIARDVKGLLDHVKRHEKALRLS